MQKAAFKAAASILGLALAAQTHAAAPAAKAPDVATDAEGAWTHFLANATFEDAYAAYGVLREVGYSAEGVVAAQCAPNAEKMRRSLAAAPVSIVLHRAAMLCAEAAGDDAAAEREFQALAALAKLALHGLSESHHAKPIRVLRYDDVFALLAISGFEFRYEWHESQNVRRGFPLVVAAWDPERKAERHLRFDWIGVVQRISREPQARYPIHTFHRVLGGLQSDAKANDIAAIDTLAVRDAFAADTIPAKVAKLRMATEAGGVSAPAAWIALCSSANVPPDCGDGLVDALLPLAEKQYARPMMLLAYAYANGIGVPRDERMGMQLLDAADQRWSRAGASVAYADLWQQHHDDVRLPPALAQRIAHAVSVGNENARMIQLYERARMEPSPPYAGAEIAYLSSPALNGAGKGYEMLSTEAHVRKDEAASQRYLQSAAEAGDAYAQAMVASNLLNGQGVARDEQAGRRWLVDAAHGGDAWAARRLAFFARSEGDNAAAEQWLLGPVAAFDAETILALADLYAQDPPGIDGDAKRAVAIYRTLSGDFAEARRSLAAMLATGTGTDKDLAQARRLWLQDAERGDHESEGQLGLMLLRGELGPVDETEGRKWVQRAIAGGDKTVANDFGYWLFYRKNSAASRKEALEVWRKALAADDYGVANNLAWALCTSPFDDVRDPKAGLDAVEAIDADMDVAEIDTVAACHAANGEFDKAQALQREVIARFEQTRANLAAARAKAKADAKAQAAVDAQLEEFRDRLAMYADGKPYLQLSDIE